MRIIAREKLFGLLIFFSTIPSIGLSHGLDFHLFDGIIIIGAFICFMAILFYYSSLFSGLIKGVKEGKSFSDKLWPFLSIVLLSIPFLIMGLVFFR